MIDATNKYIGFKSNMFFVTSCSPQIVNRARDNEF